jgi:hypothetical protein
MSTRSRIIFLRSRARPVSRAENLTAICEPTVLTMWDPEHIVTNNTNKNGDSFTLLTSQESHYVSATEPSRLGCLRKQSLFTVQTILNTQIQSEPHRKHITSPLQRPTGQCCLGNQSLFIVRTIGNTRIQSVPHRKHITAPLQSPTG